MLIRGASTHGGRGVGGRRWKKGLKVVKEAFCNLQSTHAHQGYYKRNDEINIMEYLLDITQKLATRVNVIRDSTSTAFRQLYFKHQMKKTKIECKGTLKIMGPSPNHKPMIPRMEPNFKSIAHTKHYMTTNRITLCLKSSREHRSFDKPLEENIRKTSFPGSYSHKPLLCKETTQSHATEIRDIRNKDTSIETNSPYIKNLWQHTNKIYSQVTMSQR